MRTMPAEPMIDPCPSNGRPTLGRNGGYALIALMIVVTLLLVSLTAALPSIYQASQRRREQETIFRGDQYARAIYLFYRRMGRYPVSVQDLLKTGNVRFLRKEYRDPLSSTGRWRFIHAAAGGILLDSWNQPVLSSNLPPHASALDLAFSSNPTPTGAAPATGANNGKKKKHPPSTCNGPLDSSEGSTGQAGRTGQTGTLLGAFIVGVAPCSNARSIRVFDHHSHYDQWEFLGLKYQPYHLPRPAATGATPASEMGIPNPTATPAPVTPPQGSGAGSGP